LKVLQSQSVRDQEENVADWRGVPSNADAHAFSSSEFPLPPSLQDVPHCWHLRFRDALGWGTSCPDTKSRSTQMPAEGFGGLAFADWTGNYVVTFWFGFGLGTIALIVFFVYRHPIRTGGTRDSGPVFAAGRGEWVTNPF
jgi:hypothetical protein